VKTCLVTIFRFVQDFRRGTPESKIFNGVQELAFWATLYFSVERLELPPSVKSPGRTNCLIGQTTRRPSTCYSTLWLCGLDDVYRLLDCNVLLLKWSLWNRSAVGQGVSNFY